jgi:protein subunit release factor A
MKVRLSRHLFEQEQRERNDLRNELINRGRVRTYNLMTNMVTDNIRGIRISGAKELLDGKLELLDF